MEFASVITVLLYLTTAYQSQNAALQSYDLEIGGMNATELHDIKQFATPRTESETFDSWSANWRLQNFTRNVINYEGLQSPPLKFVAPFLSRIKTWGYKITFFENYQDSFGRISSSTSQYNTPSVVHSWILEKDSELVVLPPAPPPTTTTTTTTARTTTTQASSTRTTSVITTTATSATTQSTSTIPTSLSSRNQHNLAFLIASIILASYIL